MVAKRPESRSVQIPTTAPLARRARMGARAFDVSSRIQTRDTSSSSMPAPRRQRSWSFPSEHLQRCFAGTPRAAPDPHVLSACGTARGRLPGPAAVGPDGGPAPPRVRGQIPAGRKHFFIPHEKYLGGNDNMQARVDNKDDVIFPRRGELAVVWGGIGKSTG